MKIIYIDPIDFKCHINNDGTRIPYETNIFNGKCDAFIEGYRIIPEGQIWTRSDGYTFTGEMVSPWKNYSELDAVQREYEQEKLVEYKIQQEELNTSYQEGINSI